ncbi:MAG: iron permease [Rhodobacteraceae bacterium]|nr:iron permease [Paracoccaceae bacterium]
MLATLVIGLREGLEASLIVGIIAAFLRRNGKSLTPMWLGVALAIALSIAVGGGLSLLEQALPQAEQEALETVIGAIAVFFVTGMIVWMSAHARHLKRELEAEAAAALTHAGAFALTAMAFLAVLREGFETSVFLLATFSAAQSAALAAAGAIVGLALSVVIGWGIYAGGVKINLSRFFRITGGFLILVAAGLALSSLRTAHEAGWLLAGQQRTLDLSWLVAPGTVQSALITGVLGVPADPRLIEVLGWLAYLVPVTLFVYWPQARRPAPQAAARLKLVMAAVLALVAATLPLAIPAPRPAVPDTLTLAAPAGGTARLGAAGLIVTPAGGAARIIPLPVAERHEGTHDGITASTWALRDTATPAGVPDQLTLDQVIQLAGRRVPPGLNPAQHPGPYDARWSVITGTSVWVAQGVLLDAAQKVTTVLTLTGSGLPAPRVLTVPALPGAAAAPGWRVDPAQVDTTVAALRAFAGDRLERRFWANRLPVVLVLVALLIAAAALRTLIRLRRTPASGAGPRFTSESGRRAYKTTKGVPHAAP